MTCVSSASITSMHPARGVLDAGPDGWHLLGQHIGQPAQRIDGLVDLGKARVDPFGDIVELGAGIAVPQPLANRHDPFLRRVVVLVLDLADDLLDQVFDGDHPVGARVFVEHDGEVDAAGAHVGQHVERAARLRHEQRLAHQRGPVGGRRAPVAMIGKTSLMCIMPIT